MQENSVKFLDRNQPEFTVAAAAGMAEAVFGLRGELKPLPSERDQNFRLRTATGAGYVLKIANVDEDPGVVGFQTAALRHMAQEAPALPLPRVVPTSAGEPWQMVAGADGAAHLVRVVSYLPGMLMRETAQTPAMWRNLGRFLAQTDVALRGFFHPHGRHELLWDVTQSARLRPHIVHITDPTVREQVDGILERMETAVLPQLRRLRHQVIHNDAHESNVLVDPANPDQIAGLLDFGDMIYAPLIQEVAIAANVRGMPLAQSLDKIAAIAAGYDSVLPLEAEEIDLIYDLVLARLAITATIIAWRREETPERPAFLPELEQGCWQSMADLLAVGKTAVCDHIRRACRFPVYSVVPGTDDGRRTTDDGAEIERLLERRQQVLGKHLAHFYRNPVHLERGRGAWLYGPDGTPYLDAYNNVPTVGHCHPQVVKAIARQTAVLNTNTRYIYRNILDYAERLVSTLPDHITVCAFVNSGSEANDIAWRIARHISGNDGAIIVENAYHGITEAIKALSPRGVPLEPHVRTLLTPNPYRGRYRAGEPDLAEKYAADADRAIADLAAAGRQPAAFMIDSAFVSNGSPDVPEGYLTAVAAKVRAVGGLIIADEVQAGFGRSGSHLWGHAAHGLHPDIVTMGKPVGNGFPLGVVATTADILNSFVGKVGLFSTFGGNPVACAAGMAVLDVIEDEALIANAGETGSYLRAGIRGLMDRYPIIGNVSGRGLLAGVDLVRDRVTLEPAVPETVALINRMREARVLIGKGGDHGNVLKIRPPLAFRREHADILLEALEGALMGL